MNIYNTHQAFKLESGEIIENLQIAYHTFGTFDPSKNNVVWVTHALTANSDVFDWWNGVFGENDLFNPSEHFIVCANILGSHYGTSGPLNTFKNDEPVLDHFPFVTTRDMARAHDLLREHLADKNIPVIHKAPFGHEAPNSPFPRSLPRSGAMPSARRRNWWKRSAPVPR